MGGLNLLTKRDNLLISDDFNLGLHNLGLNVQGLEERGLLGVETCRSHLDRDVARSKSTNLSGGFSGLLIDDSLYFGEISVSEDKTSVTLEQVNDLFKFVAILP